MEAGDGDRQSEALFHDRPPRSWQTFWRGRGELSLRNLAHGWSAAGVSGFSERSAQRLDRLVAGREQHQDGTPSPPCSPGTTRCSVAGSQREWVVSRRAKWQTMSTGR
nr:hypothetical protein CFP56_02954 [Quercus suber]